MLKSAYFVYYIAWVSGLSFVLVFLANSHRTEAGAVLVFFQ